MVGTCQCGNEPQASIECRSSLTEPLLASQEAPCLTGLSEQREGTWEPKKYKWYVVTLSSKDQDRHDSNTVKTRETFKCLQIFTMHQQMVMSAINSRIL
jgi:hypothetical protein